MTPGRSRKRKRKFGRIRAGFFNNNSSKYRTLLTSTVTAVLCMFALTATTFAWFHAKALTKDSYVTTGYMSAELMMKEEDIKAAIIEEEWWLEEWPSQWQEKHPGESVPDPMPEPTIEYVSDEDINTFRTHHELQLDKYERQVKKEGQEASPAETYYNITDESMKVITLKDVEPGQAYPVHFYVANTGELAFTYSAGFKIVEGGSITGLERLDREVADEKYGKKDPGEEESPEYYKNNREWKKRNRVLTRYQSVEEVTDEDGNPVTDEDGNPVMEYIGGHLEDVLKVYIVPDGIAEGEERKVLHPEDLDPELLPEETPDLTDMESVEDKDNPFYVGTIAEITGKGSSEEEKSPLLRRFIGYLLPESVVRKTEGEHSYIVPVTQTIVDEDEHEIRTEEDATELGELRFLIVAPDDMTNIYQYAQLSISIGAYATQVEYEKDGTNYMIYDKGAHEVPQEETQEEPDEPDEDPEEPTV